MSFEECYLGHTPILDHTTGTEVCVNCAHVLNEFLTYDEVHYKTPILSQPNNNHFDVKIDGEPIISILQKIGDKLHLYESSMNNCLMEFFRIKSKMTQMLHEHFAGPQKNRRQLLSNKNLLVYSIYTTLKFEECPRSLKEICYYAGGIPFNAIHQIEKFFCSQDKHNSLLTTKRLKPISAKDLILSHYTYLDMICFDDVNQILKLLDIIKPNSFSPSTTAAGLVYLYVKFIKKCKITFVLTSALFKVTSMSVQRFVKRYKMTFLKM